MLRMCVFFALMAVVKNLFQIQIIRQLKESSRKFLRIKFFLLLS
jgi:hypothetical protein